MKRIRVIVTGKVQGVSFRASTASEAERLGLTGWVRNLPDGRVELEAQGDSVEELVRWCSRGPRWASVSGVESEELDTVVGERGFRIR
jgi:acylphosphatase